MHFPCLETKLNATGIQRKFSVSQRRTWQTFTKFNISHGSVELRKSLCLLLFSTLPESFLHRPRKKSIEYILIEKFIWFFRKPKSIQRREIQTNFKMHFSKLSNCNLSNKLTSCLTERSLLSSKGFELVFVFFKILIVCKRVKASTVGLCWSRDAELSSALMLYSWIMPATAGTCRFLPPGRLMAMFSFALMAGYTLTIPPTTTCKRLREIFWWKTVINESQ